jgi:hypothetical protein
MVILENEDLIIEECSVDSDVYRRLVLKSGNQFTHYF